MSIQAWFVSDIHMTDMNDEKAGMFLAFLTSLGTERVCSHLFLVGDIFDLWVGDHKYFAQRFQPIIQQLQRLILDGVEVHYFEGNHDLHLTRYFQNQLGAIVHTGPSYFQLADKRVRVEHGDESDPDDRGYLFLRWFLRTSVMRTLAYHLPGAIVNWIGERASSKSRSYTSETKTIQKEDARKKLRLHAQKVWAERAFDLLINGHVHFRDQYESENFTAINLGTWLDEPGVLKLEGSIVEWVPL